MTILIALKVFVKEVLVIYLDVNTILGYNL